MTETVRGIVKFRDDLENEDVTEMFDEFESLVAEGEDPEECIAQVFGLEPDYLFDEEVWGRVERAFLARKQREEG